MPKCTVCTHPERDEIERQLLRGEPERDIADRFGLSKSSVHRHKQAHLAKRMAQASEASLARDTRSADELLEGMRELQESLASRAGLIEEIIDGLSSIAKDPNCLFAHDAKGKPVFVGGPLLKSLAEFRKYLDTHSRFIEIEGRLRKLIDEKGVTVNLLMHPEWIELRQTIVTALRPYPEAKRALSNVLKERDASAGD